MHNPQLYSPSGKSERSERSEREASGIASRRALGEVRVLRTDNLQALEAAQPRKNRHYLQLEPGRMSADLVEVQLETTQVFRERLGPSMRVEAAPDSGLVPFAAVLSPGSARFCGEDLDRRRLVQATGGHWDIHFRGGIDYVSWVFDRAAFEQGVERLWGCSPRPDWFVSRPRPVSPAALNQMGSRVAALLTGLQARPEVSAERNVLRLLEASLMRLTVSVLTSSESPGRLPPFSRRRRGVRRVVDSLAARPGWVPTLPELCAVAGVSERTLEYGFREELGVTPHGYLRLVRMGGARRELLRESTTTTRVTDVALRWGFLEAGRFAGEYRNLFGELPSQTLRRA